MWDMSVDMVLYALSSKMEFPEDVFKIQRLFDDFKSKHKKADRYTFLALLEIFCRNGMALDEMIQAIELEMKHGAQ